MYSISSTGAPFFVPPSSPRPTSPSPASPISTSDDISPLASALRRVSIEDSPPRIRLEDVPEAYRGHFAFLRAIGSISSAHLLDRVLTLESKRFAPLLKRSADIKALMQTSQSTYAAAHCLLRHRTEWPVHRNALYESTLGDDYRAYSECRLNFFQRLDDSFSTETGPPTWPRTHLEVRGGACSLESPKGQLHVRFVAQAEQISLTYIDLASSWRRKIFRFGEQRHLARCGIGIPDKWVQNRSSTLHLKMDPVYASSRFQPVALSPDEKAVFCILEKENGSPLILKIREECHEQIPMPPELQSEIRHICSMVCNAANTLFIYCGRNDAQQLHILEEGKWSRLDLYRAGPDGESIVDNRNFYVSNVSSKGDIVLTPHDVNDSPLLIKLARHACDREGCRNEDAEGPLQWWKMPSVGDRNNYLEPSLFAFSQDGEFLALSSRNLWSTIFRQTRACVLHLKGLSPKSLKIGGNLGPYQGFLYFGCQVPIECSEWSQLPNFGDQNDRMLSFSDDNLTLTRAIHDPATNTITSYSAAMPPRVALKPLFDPFVKIIDKEIDRLNSESEAARKPKASTNL